MQMKTPVADSGWRGIEETPGVCEGRTEATILTSYPTVRAADLVPAWAYGDAWQSEIDEDTDGQLTEAAQRYGVF